eukprot:72316-Chlamydomonas_euryale.AAC.1
MARYLAPPASTINLVQHLCHTDDPVINSMGQIYDRAAIEAHLSHRCGRGIGHHANVVVWVCVAWQLCGLASFGQGTDAALPQGLGPLPLP